MVKKYIFRNKDKYDIFERECSLFIYLVITKNEARTVYKICNS